jgi:hypothetical protein
VVGHVECRVDASVTLTLGLGTIRNSLGPFLHGDDTGRRLLPAARRFLVAFDNLILGCHAASPVKTGA